MRIVKRSSERRELQTFLSEKAGHNCVIFWADGIPSLHGRRRAGTVDMHSDTIIGIGSTVATQDNAEGIIGAFFRERVSDHGQKRVYLVSAGHVFSECKLKGQNNCITHPHDSVNTQVVAVVEKSMAPKANSTCVADFGLGLKYHEIHYDSCGIGDLGKLLGYYTRDEVIGMPGKAVTKIARPSGEDLKIAKVAGKLEAAEFDLGNDEIGIIDDVVLLQWTGKGFSKKGDSGSLVVSIDDKKALGIIAGSKRGNLDGTGNFSYASFMETILDQCRELELEVYK